MSTPTSEEDPSNRSLGSVDLHAKHAEGIPIMFERKYLRYDQGLSGASWICSTRTTQASGAIAERPLASSAFLESRWRRSQNQ